MIHKNKLIQELFTHCRVPVGIELSKESLAKGNAFVPRGLNGTSIGPNHPSARQKAPFQNKFTSAMFGIQISNLVWSLGALEKHGEMHSLIHFIEALFCFQVDPKYLKPNESYRFMPSVENKPFVEQCEAYFLWIFFNDYLRGYTSAGNLWPIYPPVTPSLRMIAFTKYILDDSFSKKNTVFNKKLMMKMDDILHFADSRVDSLPPKSPLDMVEAESIRAFGFSLSPWSLNVDEKFDAVTNFKKIDEVLREIDWSKNPFLCSPEELTTKGFQGQPYRVPR